jgi:hypothetical protein
MAKKERATIFSPPLFVVVGSGPGPSTKDRPGPGTLSKGIST